MCANKYTTAIRVYMVISLKQRKSLGLTSPNQGRVPRVTAEAVVRGVMLRYRGTYKKYQGYLTAVWAHDDCMYVGLSLRF